MADRWNHNIHYHRLVLDAVPVGSRTALDVGTGNGLLAQDLLRVVPSVVGIDLDASVLASAMAEEPRVEWVLGDVMTHPFELGSFDVVAAVATLHHLRDLDAALRRLADLTAPGGVLSVVGLARSSGPIDALFDAAGMVQHRVLAERRLVWEHSAPVVWPPPHTFAEVRSATGHILPGARWRRLAMWRYSIAWTKPTAR